jgi:hypothetical protein
LVAFLGAAYPTIAWAAPLLAMFAMVVLRRQSLLGVGGAMLAASLAGYSASRGRYEETLVHSVWRCGNGSLEGWLIAVLVFVTLMHVFTAALALSVPSVARRVVLVCAVAFASASTVYFAMRGKLDRFDLNTYEAGLTTVELSPSAKSGESGRLHAHYTVSCPVAVRPREGVPPATNPGYYPPQPQCNLSVSYAEHHITETLALVTAERDTASVTAPTASAASDHCPSLRVRADFERHILIVEGTDPKEGYLKFAFVQGVRRDLKRADLRDLTGLPAPWWLSVALLVGLGLMGCAWAMSTHRARVRLVKVPHLGGGWFELPGGARVPGPEPVLGVTHGWVAPHDEHPATYRSGELPVGITVLPAHASDRTHDRIDGFLAWALGCFAFAAALLAGHA